MKILLVQTALKPDLQSPFSLWCGPAVHRKVQHFYKTLRCQNSVYVLSIYTDPRFAKSNRQISADCDFFSLIVVPSLQQVACEYTWKIDILML